MTDSDRITYFAETDARNRRIKFGIKPKDRLRHLYVIGKTGVGKSTLLENMAIQDIQNGEGMAFVDPHGGTAEKLLDYIPENRIKDVLYFAPFDTEYPVSFNILEDIGADKRHLVVNGLMSTFEKIWVDAWSPRMAYILQNTILALLETPGSTLLGVNRVLIDKDFRNKIIANIKDPSTKSFWVDEFAKYTDRYAAEATPAIQNKVGQFTSNPLVRNIVGQPKSSFDIRKMMDEKKIIIANLSKGRVGEGNANLIGAMLITKIYLAAMSRADKSDTELAKLPSFYLYVDEFQSFANKSFADILSEARKYKLSLNIAHQYVEQMEEEVRDAVFGNVGTTISFRVGALDAELLEKEFAPTFTAEDLVNLGFAQIYLKLMIDGISSAPFSAVTMPPIPKPEKNFHDDVVAESRKQFARPRADVEGEIVSWHAPVEPSAVPEKKNSDRQQPGRFSATRPERPAPPSAFSSLGKFGEKVSQNVQDSHVQNGFDKPKESPDQNKAAFMRAAVELEERKNVQPSAPFPVKENNNIPKISLQNLSGNSEAKKIPTRENLSSLKEALSKIVGEKTAEKVPEPRPFQEQKKSEESSKRYDLDKTGGNSKKITESPAIFSRPVKENFEKKSIGSEWSRDSKIDSPESPRSMASEKKDTGKDMKDSGQKNSSNRREIPEDVLRKLLKMDDEK
jgi:hypothetical protein